MKSIKKDTPHTFLSRRLSSAMREALAPGPAARGASIRAKGRHGTVAAGPCPPAAGVVAPSTAGAGGVACEKRQEGPFRQRP